MANSSVETRDPHTRIDDGFAIVAPKSFGTLTRPLFTLPAIETNDVAANVFLAVGALEATSALTTAGHANAAVETNDAAARIRRRLAIGSREAIDAEAGAVATRATI